jgi:hypothetical protein
LTVTDTSDGVTETFKLVGDYSNSTWTVTDDHHGGVDIVDPPATTEGGSIGGVIMHDPGPVTDVVATGSNQTLTGTGASDNFVFNFSGFGQDAITNFRPDADTLQFSGAMFATAQAALDAAQDDGHGNTVIVVGHDTIVLDGVLKNQLHLSDFHVV